MPLPIFQPERLPARRAATFRPAWAHEHAANDAFPAPGPAAGTGWRDQPPAPRLAVAFFASLMLHLGLAVIASATLTYTVVGDTSPPLQVRLAQAPTPARQSSDVPAATAPSALPSEPQPLRENIGPPQQPARFLVDPDLSVLEEIPTTFPGVVSLRLKVTSQGTVEDVSVVRADPVPKELLDGLIQRFGKARLTPAMVGSQAVASTVEVTIRVDPPAQFFDPLR